VKRIEEEEIEEEEDEMEKVNARHLSVCHLISYYSADSDIPHLLAGGSAN
jgi:hypothetical protein